MTPERPDCSARPWSQPWNGWVKGSISPHSRWHRVEYDSRTSLAAFACIGRRRYVQPSEVMDYRWSPGFFERCLKCWPPGIGHPSELADATMIGAAGAVPCGESQGGDSRSDPGFATVPAAPHNASQERGT